MPTAPDAVLKSLADPTRRAIFERLCRAGEQTVWRLTEEAGVSQHLRQPKRARLVRLRKTASYFRDALRP